MRIPLAITNLSAHITSKYGPRAGGHHNGLDLSRVPVDSPVFAALHGKVISVDIVGNSNAGRFVRLDHGNGLETRYLHLNAVHVTLGQQVTTNTPIGTMGWTGHVIPSGPNGAHLHFEVIVNRKPVDPEPYLRGEKVHGPTVLVDERKVSVPTKLVGGRAMVLLEGEAGQVWVQIRAISDLVGARLAWDEASYTAKVVTK